MGKANLTLFQHLKERLEFFHNEIHPLIGITDAISKECLIDQMIDSIRRIEYVERLLESRAVTCPDARNKGFNPIVAAIFHQKEGNVDEAMWLVFLLTYFGKSNKSKWELIRNFYSNFGQSSAFWTWDEILNSIEEFSEWALFNQDKMKNIGSFSNHRRYIGFNPESPTGILVVIKNYIAWIQFFGNHEGLIKAMTLKSTNSSSNLFRSFYKSIPSGLSLARLGKFDFITMLSKVGIVKMEPDSTYLVGSSGPKSGANLLFNGVSDLKNSEIKSLEEKFDLLATNLAIPFSMQVLEDSVCNWQKSPFRYQYFKG